MDEKSQKKLEALFQQLNQFDPVYKFESTCEHLIEQLKSRFPNYSQTPII